MFQLKNFFDSIAATKLDAKERIVFPDKAVLYKKEKNTIIYFNWRKLAVAAILLGLGTWTTLQLITPSKKPEDKLAGTSPIAPKSFWQL
jgi:hypothetical protein